MPETTAAEHRHRRALDQQDKAWLAMRSARLYHGSASDQYREARQQLIDARRVVTYEARRRWSAR